MSTSWQRAQTADAVAGPVNAAEWDLLLGDGSPHRVLFAVYDGELRAECDCRAFEFRDFCAHVARLWWRWVRSELGVTDLDTGATYLTPPWWLSVDDAEHDRVDAAEPQPARADGGSCAHAESARARVSSARNPPGGCTTYTKSGTESPDGETIDRVPQEPEMYHSEGER